VSHLLSPLTVNKRVFASVFAVMAVLNHHTDAVCCVHLYYSECIPGTRGFNDGIRKVLKEVAVYDLRRDKLVSCIFLPPWSLQCDDVMCLRESPLFSRLHAQYFSGNIPYENAECIIRSYTRRYACVYIKSAADCHYLRSILNVPVFSLDDLGCPSIDKLPMHHVSCLYDIPYHTAEECARSAAKAFGMWLNHYASSLGIRSASFNLSDNAHRLVTFGGSPRGRIQQASAMGYAYQSSSNSVVCVTCHTVESSWESRIADATNPICRCQTSYSHDNLRYLESDGSAFSSYPSSAGASSVECVSNDGERLTYIQL
jgi:hypothetical protein